MFKAPKESKYLKLNQIQGQEQDHDQEQEQYSSFNMKQEFEDGDFTKDGVYVHKQDVDKIHDS